MLWLRGLGFFPFLRGRRRFGFGFFFRFFARASGRFAFFRFLSGRRFRFDFGRRFFGALGRLPVAHFARPDRLAFTELGDGGGGGAGQRASCENREDHREGEAAHAGRRSAVQA